LEAISTHIFRWWLPLFYGKSISTMRKERKVHQKGIDLQMNKFALIELELINWFCKVFPSTWLWTPINTVLELFLDMTEISRRR
jgi:hypothetical protein